MPSNPKIKPRFICKLLLPEGVEVANRGVVGEARKNLTLAKRDACYHACVQLHASGALQRAVGADYVLIKHKRATDGRNQLIRQNEERRTNIEDFVDDERRLLYIVKLPRLLEASDIAGWLLEQAGRPRIQEVSVFPPSVLPTDPAIFKEGPYSVIKLVGPEDVHAVKSVVRMVNFDNSARASEVYSHPEIYELKIKSEPGAAGRSPALIPPSLRPLGLSVQQTENSSDEANEGEGYEEMIVDARKSGALIADEDGWIRLDRFDARRAGHRRNDRNGGNSRQSENSYDDPRSRKRKSPGQSDDSNRFEKASKASKLSESVDEFSEASQLRSVRGLASVYATPRANINTIDGKSLLADLEKLASW
jgi:hypothetical protein